MAILSCAHADTDKVEARTAVENKVTSFFMVLFPVIWLGLPLAKIGLLFTLFVD